MARDDPDRYPQALLIQPEIPPHLHPAIEAFRQLSRTRPAQVGMGSLFLPIQTSEAFAMAEAIGWPPLDFLAVIRPAEDLYVEEINRRKAT